jgi:guanosine-3',5'-bis(diphosphate) 3'-pyrophosphohydrolase
MNETLEQVIAFADRAHGEQKRKYSNERYIVHPIRVMQTCQEYTDDICILSAAILHDVLEDTAVCEEEIRLFLDGLLSPHQTIRTLRLVVELTDIYTKKNYPSLNRRARKIKEAQRLTGIGADAQTIKYADIIDNAINITLHDPDFSVVFLREGAELLKHLNSGNKELHERAVQTVEDCLQQLETKRPVEPKRPHHHYRTFTGVRTS